MTGRERKKRKGQREREKEREREKNSEREKERDRGIGNEREYRYDRPISELKAIRGGVQTICLKRFSQLIDLSGRSFFDSRRRFFEPFNFFCCLFEVSFVQVADSLQPL